MGRGRLGGLCVDPVEEHVPVVEGEHGYVHDPHAAEALAKPVAPHQATAARPCWSTSPGCGTGAARSATSATPPHCTSTSTAYLGQLADAARPHHLRVEHPIDAGTRDAQIAGLAGLRADLRRSGIAAGLVADEYTDSLPDIRAFNRAGTADMDQIKTPDLGGLDQAVDAPAEQAPRRMPRGFLWSVTR